MLVRVLPMSAIDKIWLLIIGVDILEDGQADGSKRSDKVTGLDLVNEGNINQREASSRLGITPRPVRHLIKRFEEEGFVWFGEQETG
jgi:predicted ArsR family transcriptional regulator